MQFRSLYTSTQLQRFMLQTKRDVLRRKSFRESMKNGRENRSKWQRKRVVQKRAARKRAARSTKSSRIECTTGAPQGALKLFAVSHSILALLIFNQRLSSAEAIAIAPIAAVSARRMLLPRLASVHPLSAKSFSSSWVQPPSGPNARRMSALA